MADRQFLPRCVPHSSGRGVLLILLFFLISGTALPQQGTDIRISEDIREPAIPSDIRIQTGAELADARLAVWGTTVEGPSGEARNALVFDLGNGPQPLHSSDAEPYAQVAVAPLTDRFLLLWNDRRPSGAGIYGRVVLKDGSFGGPEYLFSSGGKLEDRVYWMNGLTGTTILWNDVRGAEVMVYRRRVDGEGRVVGIEESLGSGGIVEHQVSRLPDGRVVLGRESGEGMVLGIDGEMESKGIAAERLRRPHYMGEDGSFAMLDSNRFLYYEDIRAPEPVWEKILGSVHGREVQYDMAVIRQRADTFVVVWPTFLFRWTEPRERGGYFALETQTLLFLSKDDSIRVAWEYLDLNGVNDGVPATFAFKRYLGECAGSSWVLVAIDRGVESYYLSRYSVDNQGYSTHQGVTGGRGEIFEEDRLDLLYNCRPLDLPGVARLRSDTLSTIRVQWSDGPVELTASTAGYRPTPHDAPVIGIHGDRLVVGWYRPEINELGEIRFDRFPILIEESRVQSRADQNNTTAWLGPTRYQGGGGYVNLIVAATQRTIEHWPVTDVYLGLFAHVLKESGWRRLRMRESRVQLSGSRFPNASFYAVGHDPDLDLSAVAFAGPLFDYSGNTCGYAIISDTATASGEFPCAWRPRYILPVDSTTVLLIGDDDSLRSVGAGKNPQVFFLPSATPFQPSGYWKMSGSRLLRELREDGTKTRQFQLLSLDGMLLHSTTLEDVVDSVDFFPIENRKDGSVVLLQGSPEGVRCFHFDSELRLLADPSGRSRSGIRISSEQTAAKSPAGVIRNDSLFFVWLGEADQVYGNVVDLRKPLSSVREHDPAADDLRIIPNPAGDLVRLQLPFVVGTDALVECIDAAGNSVSIRTMRSSVKEILLDVSNLPSQIYLVRVSSAYEKVEGRMIVVR